MADLGGITGVAAAVGGVVPGLGYPVIRNFARNPRHCWMEKPNLFAWGQPTEYRYSAASYQAWRGCLLVHMAEVDR